MGTSVSRFEILLDQDKGQHEPLPLAAGSLLQGKVVIELKGSLQMMRANRGVTDKNDDEWITPQGEPPLAPALQVRLYGKEKVRMNRGKSVRTAGTNNGRARKSAERPILNLCMQWPTFPMDETVNTTTASDSAVDPSVIPAGTYVFPFQIPLPASLPSSTYFPVHDNRARSKMRFRIQYKLVAALNVNSKPLCTTRYLWIAAASPNPPPDPVPCMVEPISQELRGGFFHKGTFLFGASLENCCVQDSLQLHVSCRNDSSAVIQCVQISVLEKLTWGTAAINQIDPVTGACKTSSTLQQTETIPVIVLKDVQLPGLTKERKGMLRSVVDTVFGSPQQKLQRQIYDDLITGENLIRIQLPASARESYQGQLLQVSHVLRIQFQTGAFVTKPVLDIPIHILGTAKPENPQQPHQPAVASGAGEAYHMPPPAAAKPLPKPLPVPPKKPTKPLTPATTGIAASATVGTSIATSETAPTGKKMAHNEIPLVSAVRIPGDAVQASVALADVVVLGGDAVSRPGSRRRMASLANLVPMAAPTVVSVPALLGEIRSSINDFELIADKLLDPAWIALFQKITSDEFGSIVSCIHEFDQPRVAVLLAPHLNNSSGLTCTYTAAALRNTSANHRAVMAQKLLPLCVDVKTHPDLIRAELNEWEQTVTGSAFEEAMRQNGIRRQ